MTLYLDFGRGARPAPSVPPCFARKFAFWKSKISPEHQQAIKDEINAYLDGLPPEKRVCVTTFMAGRDWRGKARQEIYEALGDEDQAAMCLGLFMWNTVAERPDPWGSGHYKFHRTGEDLPSRCYFLLGHFLLGQQP